MIQVHHGGRDQEPFLLNPDLIRTVETRPDTIVALTDGDQIWVRETPEQLTELVKNWRAQVLRRALEPEPKDS